MILCWRGVPRSFRFLFWRNRKQEVPFCAIWQLSDQLAGTMKTEGEVEIGNYRLFCAPREKLALSFDVLEVSIRKNVFFSVLNSIFAAKSYNLSLQKN